MTFWNFKNLKNVSKPDKSSIALNPYQGLYGKQSFLEPLKESCITENGADLKGFYSLSLMSVSIGFKLLKQDKLHL